MYQYASVCVCVNVCGRVLWVVSTDGGILFTVTDFGCARTIRDLDSAYRFVYIAFSASYECMYGLCVCVEKKIWRKHVNRICISFVCGWMVFEYMENISGRKWTEVMWSSSLVEENQLLLASHLLQSPVPHQLIQNGELVFGDLFQRPTPPSPLQLSLYLVWIL